MPAASTYVRGRRPGKAARTRRQIVAAARELLDEGVFHESTSEQIAERAGISRATLYQHFNSRLDIVDAICETFGDNPSLRALRDTVVAAQPERALEQTVAHAVGFWESERGVLRQLYGVAAVDQAAADLVGRQRADRRGEMKRLVGTLKRAGSLRQGLADDQALALLMMLTSFETFEELRRERRSAKGVAETLGDSARSLLLA